MGDALQGEAGVTLRLDVCPRVPHMAVALPPPELAIVRAVNAERTAHGLRALRPVRGLSRAAERHSRDQLSHDRLDHASSDGTTFARRIARTGRYRTAGEVIAFTPRGAGSRARAVVRLWMGSPAHRAELMNPAFRIMGVGRVRGGIGGLRGAVVTADLAAR